MPATNELPFSLSLTEGYIDQLLAAADWQESGSREAPHLPLMAAENAGHSAGYTRVWQALRHPSLDRMVHTRLIAGPVETQLLFVFGKPESTLPHLHLQFVQYPPTGFVYNVDFLPRVDPALEPEWFEQVFGPLRRPFRKATSDKQNSCAQAPQNPALAALMSPWGIASGQADQAEVQRVKPCIDAYLDHYCELINTDDWVPADKRQTAERDARHLQLFFADEMDPRAWNGVYRIVGEDAGRQIKSLFSTALN